MPDSFGMNSRVHPNYKTRYRVGNWPSYDRALVQRGDITMWISEDAIDAWAPRPSRNDEFSTLELRCSRLAAAEAIPKQVDYDRDQDDSNDDTVCGIAQSHLLAVSWEREIALPIPVWVEAELVDRAL